MWKKLQMFPSMDSWSVDLGLVRKVAHLMATGKRREKWEGTKILISLKGTPPKI